MAAAEPGSLMSRKFITTNFAIALGTMVTVLGMYWEADVNPGFYVLIGVGIGAYNWSNLRQSQNGSAP